MVSIEKIKSDLEMGGELVFTLEEWEEVDIELSHHYHYSEWILQAIWRRGEVIVRLLVEPEDF